MSDKHNISCWTGFNNIFITLIKQLRCRCYTVTSGHVGQITCVSRVWRASPTGLQPREYRPKGSGLPNWMQGYLWASMRSFELGQTGDMMLQMIKTNEPSLPMMEFWAIYGNTTGCFSTDGGWSVTSLPTMVFWPPINHFGHLLFAVSSCYFESKTPYARAMVRVSGLPLFITHLSLSQLNPRRYCDST